MPKREAKIKKQIFYAKEALNPRKTPHKEQKKEQKRMAIQIQYRAGQGMYPTDRRTWRLADRKYAIGRIKK